MLTDFEHKGDTNLKEKMTFAALAVLVAVALC
jgi:hypothetical protein